MIVYVVIGIFVGLPVIFGIVALTWGRKIKIAKNCEVITEKYSWCTAELFLDKEIPQEGDTYFIGEEKIPVSKKQLAFACAVTMKTVNYYCNKYKFFGSKGNLKEATFVFLNDEAYDKTVSKYTKVNTNGLSRLAKPNMFGKGKQTCYMRAEFMPQIANNGQLAIHEFLHCFLRETTGSGDGDHKSNYIILENGKNIEQLSSDTIHSIVKNKFNLKN